MHTHSLKPWRHDHVFEQDTKLVSERRLSAVVAVTATVMAAEIAAGLAFGSMALLADGLHMATHALALGLAVNLASALILGHDHDHDHDHGVDHNHRAAHFHVLADAVASLLAIAALGFAWGFGADWLDPLVGVAGAALIARWGVGLMRESAAILLDAQAPEQVLQAIAAAIECDDDARISDLHVWTIGVGRYAAQISVVAAALLSPADYKARLNGVAGIVHLAVEVNRCPGPH